MCAILNDRSLRDFLWWGTRPICGTRIHYHALVIDMAHAIGSGIPAPSKAIDVCFSNLLYALANINQLFSEGMGIPAPPHGRRPEDIGQHTDERKSLLAQANDELRAISEAVACASKRRAKSDLRMVGGVRFRSKERSDVARKRVMAGPHPP